MSYRTPQQYSATTNNSNSIVAPPPSGGGGSITTHHSTHMYPPTISPTSGMYSPPVFVKISCEDIPTRPGDVIFYLIQESSTAADIASEKGYATLSGRRKYNGPFQLHHPGRVKVTAFVYNPETGDGPSASALYMVDGNAPPAAMETQHGTPVVVPKTSIAGATVGHALTGSGVSAAHPLGAAGAQQQSFQTPVREHGQQESYLGTGAGGVTVGTSTTQHQQAQAQTTSFVSAREELPFFYDVHLLQYTQLPAVIEPFVPFSVVVHLVDSTGAPISLRLNSDKVNVAISGDVLGSKEQLPLIVVPIDSAAFSNSEATTLPIRWQKIHNLVADIGGGGLQRANTNMPGWDAYASTEPCIGVHEDVVGVSFRVTNLCRVIVGLHGKDVDVGKDSSWKLLPFSIHLSADLHDPATVPAFRIYQDGNLSETVGTREYSVGDYFSIRVQSGGRVVYYHNEAVIARSEFPVPKGTTLSAVFRVGSQQSGMALSNLEMIRQDVPVPLEIGNLIWKSPLSLSEVEHREPPQTVVLRTWIVGTEFIPATARIPLQKKAVPRWAMAAVSLASMFALGAAGCQGNQVSQQLIKAHQQDPQLKHLDDSEEHDNHNLGERKRLHDVPVLQDPSSEHHRHTQRQGKVVGGGGENNTHPLLSPTTPGGPQVYETSTTAVAHPASASGISRGAYTNVDELMHDTSAQNGGVGDRTTYQREDDFWTKIRGNETTMMAEQQQQYQPLQGEDHNVRRTFPLTVDSGDAAEHRMEPMRYPLQIEDPVGGGGGGRGGDGGDRYKISDLIGPRL